jgi:hypothetical protein
MMSFLSTIFRRHLHVGDRLRLYGGYDMEPRWLNGKETLTGKCVAFIKGQNKQPAAVVELDEPISFDDITGKTVVLELRYVGASWTKSEVVHVELCDFIPEDKAWKDRAQGVWVESHASYAIL